MMYTTKTAAAELGISVKRVNQLLNHGYIPFSVWGRRRQIAPEALEQFKRNWGCYDLRDLNNPVKMEVRGDA